MPVASGGTAGSGGHDLNTDDCTQSPCLNGGTCVDQGAAHVCKCSRNFRRARLRGAVGVGAINEATLGHTDATGSTAIGWAFRYDDGESVSAAELWDQAHGLRSLAEVLTAAGAAIEGWKLTGVAGISDDGKVLGGTGYNPQGIAEPGSRVCREPQ